MAIKFEGRTYKLRVKPGPDGLREFQNQVRQLLGFTITEDFDVTFECQIPQTGERMKLTGLSSYGAATHCAAITAAQRDAPSGRRTGGSRNRSSRRGSADSSRTAPAAAAATADGATSAASTVPEVRLPPRSSAPGELMRDEPGSADPLAAAEPLRQLRASADARLETAATAPSTPSSTESRGAGTLSSRPSSPRGGLRGLVERTKQQFTRMVRIWD